MSNEKIPVQQCKQAVQDKLKVLYRLAEEQLDFRGACTLRYDLKGTRAGTASVRYRRGAPSRNKVDNIIRLNQGMLQDPALHEEMVNDTIAHELAHIITGHLYPDERGHGRQWRRIARVLGGSGNRSHRLDVTHHRVRSVRRIPYHCSNENCGRTYQLTMIRHNRVLKGESYLCGHCRALLEPDSAMETTQEQRGV